MAVIRYPDTEVNSANYIATLAFFCCVSCVTLMLKFGRFKTSFDVYNGNAKRKSGKGHDDISSGISITGAYRTNRDEFFTYNNHSESQRKSTSVPVLTPPAPPPLPAGQQQAGLPGPLRQTKSTSDLVQNQNLPPSLREAQSGVSLDPRGADSENINSRVQVIDPQKNKKQLDAQKRVEKQRLAEQKKLEKKRLQEQKKLDKQRLVEQKRREKLALQEQAKQEKLRKEREKREAQQAKKDKKNKKAAPQKPLANPLAQSSAQAASNPIAQPSGARNSTNTLDSSISKTSGPPPYAAVPQQERKENETNSNVTFSQPGSWDMVSQHRHNVLINQHTNSAPPTIGKVTTMDLNFKLGTENNKDNSEA